MPQSSLPYNCSIQGPGKLVFIMQNSSQPLWDDARLSFHTIPDQHCPFGKAAPNLCMNRIPPRLPASSPADNLKCQESIAQLLLLPLSNMCLKPDFQKLHVNKRGHCFSTQNSKSSMQKKVSFDPKFILGI